MLAKASPPSSQRLSVSLVLERIECRARQQFFKQRTQIARLSRQSREPSGSLSGIDFKGSLQQAV